MPKLSINQGSTVRAYDPLIMENLSKQQIQTEMTSESNKPGFSFSYKIFLYENISNKIKQIENIFTKTMFQIQKNNSLLTPLITYFDQDNFYGLAKV